MVESHAIARVKREKIQKEVRAAVNFQTTTYVPCPIHLTKGANLCSSSYNSRSANLENYCLVASLLHRLPTGSYVGFRDVVIVLVIDDHPRSPFANWEPVCLLPTAKDSWQKDSKRLSVLLIIGRSGMPQEGVPLV